MSLSADVRALLTLHQVPGLGPRLTAALLERFSSPEAVLAATPEELRHVPHLGSRLAGEVADAVRKVDLGPELTALAAHRVSLVRLRGEGYPGPLAEIPDPPHLLYVRGRIDPGDERAVGIVGARSCTSYGRKIAERLAAGLARAGWVIVSGLARGIDAVAHRACLDAGGRTIAVLAGGLSKIYPPEHADLADQVEASGALVTEARMRQEPLAGLFPVRNRLISGMSRGVIVVEATDHSGTLTTARHAADQGRLVFAVPGPVDSDQSSGTHRLIREGAILVRGVEDVLEELEAVPVAPGAGPPARNGRPREVSADGPRPSASAHHAPVSSPPGLAGLEQQVWDLLAEGPRHQDELVQRLAIGAGQLVPVLLGLELKRVARRLPGNRYERA